MGGSDEAKSGRHNSGTCFLIAIKNDDHPTLPTRRSSTHSNLWSGSEGEQQLGRPQLVKELRQPQSIVPGRR